MPKTPNPLAGFKSIEDIAEAIKAAQQSIFLHIEQLEIPDLIAFNALASGLAVMVACTVARVGRKNFDMDAFLTNMNEQIERCIPAAQTALLEKTLLPPEAEAFQEDAGTLMEAATADTEAE